MAVKARFWVRSSEKMVAGAVGPDMEPQITAKVSLSPVTRKTEDNIQWSKYTPSGEIVLFVTQPEVQKWYEDRLGRDIAITFEDPED